MALKPGGQDDDVGGALAAVPSDDAGRRHVVDGLGDQLDVVPHHSLVEVAADQGALAPEGVVRGQLRLELLVRDPVVDVAQGDGLQPVGHAVVVAECDGVLEGPVELVAVATCRASAPGESALLVLTEWLVRTRQDPLGGALVHVDLDRGLRHLGDDLCRAGARSDNGDPFAPSSCSCSQRAEWNEGPPKESSPAMIGDRRYGEGPDGADEHVGLVGVSFGVGQAPAAAPLVPAGRRDPSVGP